MGKQFDEAPIFPVIDILIHYGGDPPASGRQWAPCKCPFHGQDRNPSASVNEQAQRFLCHVCMEKSEDAIGLVRWQEGCSFADAVAICESITSATNEPASKKPGGMSSMFD